MFKTLIEWELVVPATEVGKVESRAAELGVNSPCKPTGSPLADALAALYLAPHVQPDATYPLDRCGAVELDAQTLDARGAAEYRPEPGERVVILSFVVRVDGDAEALTRAVAYEQHGVTPGTTTQLLASVVDDEVSALPRPATDDLDIRIPDYWFDVVRDTN